MSAVKDSRLSVVEGDELSAARRHRSSFFMAERDRLSVVVYSMVTSTTDK